MKKNGVLFFIVLFLFGSHLSKALAQSVHGFDACNFLFDAMTLLHADVKKEMLIRGGEKDYPYNISVTFPARAKNPEISPDSEKKQEIFPVSALNADSKKEAQEALKDDFESTQTELCLIFSTEEAVRHITLISDIVRAAQNLFLPCPLRIVFSYGDNPNLEHAASLKGSESFVFSRSGDGGYCCFSVNFTNEPNAVIPCAGKISSPLSLVKHAAGAFSAAKLPYAIDGRNLYSLYRYNILKTDKRTALLLETGIPAAGININAKAATGESKKITAFFVNLIRDFKILDEESGDSHFLALKIRDKAFFIPQTFTIGAFIVLLFISLFALCEFSFFAEPLKKGVMRGVKKIWYLIPLTVLLTTLSLSAGQGLANFLYGLFNIHVFTRVSVKIAAAFFIVSIAFGLIVRFQGLFLSKSYSYLLLISAVINIFLFSAIDISLFYVFAAEYLIVYASRRARKTLVLSGVFIALIVPFIPYALQAAKYFDAARSSRLLHDNAAVNVLTAFAVLPLEFVWLKILVRSTHKRYKAQPAKKIFGKNNVLTALTAPVILLVLLAAANAFISRRIEKKKAERDIKIIAKGNGEKLSVSYSDFAYFGEVSRTVRIRLRGSPEHCALIVEGEDGNSVLYSDNSYIPEKKAGTDSFLLPAYPPEDMTFRYIADPEKKSVIRAAALYLDEGVRETGRQRYLFYSAAVEVPAQTAGGKK